MRKIIVSVLLSLLIQTSYCQNIETDRLNAYFEALEVNNKFMGTVSVSRDGQPVYSRSVGFADIDTGLKATQSSKYKVGSISKTFTSVLIFQAIEKGKLTLDQTLDKYFPAIENADKITIGQMLSHRSGISNFTKREDFLQWNTLRKTEAEMIEIIKSGGSDFEPDSQMQYSNSNYVLLTYILEKIYNKPYAKILQTNIVSPLNLKNTYLGDKIDITKGECNSYKYLDKWRIESSTDPSITVGAGAIVSTTNDLNAFSQALFDGKLVSENSLKQMETLKDNFGMGLIAIPYYDKRGYGHTGGIDGFNSIFVYFPDGKIAYSLTSNGSNCIINDISLAVLHCLHNKPFDVPDFTTVNLKSEDLDKYLGVYSCSQLPIKLTITKNGTTLIGQGTGQAAFNLEAAQKDVFVFKFTQGGIVLEFDPEKQTMTLKQGGGVFVMEKE